MTELERYEVTAADCVAAVDAAASECGARAKTCGYDEAEELSAYVRAFRCLRTYLRSETFRLECARRAQYRLSTPAPAPTSRSAP